MDTFSVAAWEYELREPDDSPGTSPFGEGTAWLHQRQERIDALPASHV